MRETSIQVYHEIKNEGLLSKRRLEVYECLFEHGPLTGKELYRLMKERLKNPNLHDTFQQRLSELQDRGLVRELGTKECNVTGRTVILWDVTKDMPVEPEKKSKRKLEPCPHCHGTGTAQPIRTELRQVNFDENQGLLF